MKERSPEGDSPRGLTAEAVLRLLESDKRRTTMTVRQMARELGHGSGPRSALRRVVADLVDEGRVVPLRGRRFGSARLLGDVVGRFSRHRAGFGFVVPDDGSGDLYVASDAQAGAFHGDVVAARVVKLKPGNRREGEVLRILERGSRRIIGTYVGSGAGQGSVVPLEAGHDFGIEVARGEGQGAVAGELVTVELDRYPEGGRPARGRVVERLGRADEPGIDVEVLIRKYGLEPEFPPEVERAAEALPGEPDAWPVAERCDFTSDIVVTIDGKTAKDFDDAIFVRRAKDGFVLDVHVADVAHFVEEGSELDLEALRRATSVYFPDRVVPMLPERLSNDLCSLVPGKLRLTQSVSLAFDAHGCVRGASFRDGVIRSAARTTYEQVAALLDGAEGAKEGAGLPAAVVTMLNAAGELAEVLGSRRAERGAIDFDLPEPELVIALTGETEEIVARSRNAAHKMIEEFMIAANEAVARELVERRARSLFRVHERPESDRIERLANALAGLGYRLPEGGTPMEPSDFARLVELARGRPEEPFVQRFVLRTMSLARYDPECLGHFGLASRRYTHFTSPIRRYPDLVVHRALRGLRAVPTAFVEDEARLEEIARECSRLEREAESAERDSISWRRAAYMSERVGDVFEGRVVEVAPYGLTIAVEEPYVEGLVPIRRLGAEYFHHDARRMTLVGRGTGKTFRLGQSLDVRVDRVDLVRHFIDFSLPGVESPRPRRQTGGETRPYRRKKRKKGRR